MKAAKFKGFITGKEDGFEVWKDFKFLLAIFIGPSLHRYQYFCGLSGVCVNKLRGTVT